MRRARGALSQWELWVWGGGFGVVGGGLNGRAGEVAFGTAAVAGVGGTAAAAVPRPVAGTLVGFAFTALPRRERAVAAERDGAVGKPSGKASWVSGKVNSVQVAGGHAEPAPSNGVFSVLAGLLGVAAVAAGGPGTTRASRHPAPIGNLGMRTHATRHDDCTAHLDGRTATLTVSPFLHGHHESSRCIGDGGRRCGHRLSGHLLSGSGGSSSAR